MMKQRLAIDMDDVLADTASRFVEYYQTRTGNELSWEKLRESSQVQLPDGTFTTLHDWVFEEGFFRGIKVMPDAQEIMKKLHEKYEIFIVSAAMEFPYSMKEKLEWMQEHFPFIDWRFIVFCGHKYMIKADYLIDDHERNLSTFEGTPLLFTAQHNLHIQDFTRVNNWQEVAEMLL